MEICINGYWHTVCTDYWDNNDASVVCRQLGHSPYGNVMLVITLELELLIVGAIGPSVSDEESRVLRYINDINCTGTESAILDCPYNGLINYGCPQSHRYANVFCKGIPSIWFITSIFAEVGSTNETNCTDGEVRLIGGLNKYRGRVEVCVNRVWGTVCGYSNWGRQEASIVCKQIGGMRYGTYYNYANRIDGIEKGSGPILLGYLKCTGEEKALTECDQSYSYTNFYCRSHYYDAGVICQRKSLLWYLALFS